MMQPHWIDGRLSVLEAIAPAALLLIGAAVQLWVTGWQYGSATFFGVRVPPGFQDGDEGSEIDSAYVREIWLLTASILGLAGIGLSLEFHSAEPRAYAFGSLGIVLAHYLGMQMIYWRAHQKTLPFAAPLDPSRTADLASFVRLSLGWRLTYWTAVLLPLAALGITAQYLHAHFALIPLPWRVLRVFDAAAENSPWTRGEIFGVYRPLAVAALLNLGFIMVAYAFNYRSRISEWGAEETSRRSYRKLLMSRLVILQWLSTMQFILDDLRPLAGTAVLPVARLRFLWFSPIWLVIESIGSLVLIYTLYRNRPKGTADKGPDESWKLGIYYFNPQDPALIVPTRFGAGHTLNFGQWMAWAVPALSLMMIGSTFLGSTYTPQFSPSIAAIAPPRRWWNPGPAPKTYQQALDQLDRPFTRERAAEVLVGMARTDPSIANHVAHKLALQRTHLVDAEALARSSIAQLELRTAKIPFDHPTAEQVQSMRELAAYWDSLGMVRLAVSDLQDARRYCGIAWNLGGRGLYLQHAAKAATAAGDRALARHLYQVSLTGAMADGQKENAMYNLAALGVNRPQPIEEPEVIAIHHQRNIEGNARFLLGFEARGTAKVKWLDGDKALAAMAPAIARAHFPPQMPDQGPEHVLRVGEMVCRAAECKLTLLYAWQIDLPWLDSVLAQQQSAQAEIH